MENNNRNRNRNNNNMTNNKSNIYVATRLDHDEMSTILNSNVIWQLNERLAKSLRTPIMRKGIKKTEQGKRLEFYNLTYEQYEQLNKTHSDMILAIVDKDELSNKLEEINNKYPSRMNPDLFYQYNRDLENALDSSVQIVGQDKNPSPIAKRLMMEEAA